MRSLVTLSASALLLVACSSSEPATSEDAPVPVESPSAPAELPEVPSATDVTSDPSAPPASPVEGEGEVGGWKIPLPNAIGRKRLAAHRFLSRPVPASRYSKHLKWGLNEIQPV